MTIHLTRRALMAGVAVPCLAAMFGAAWGARATVPAEAQEFVLQRGIMANRPDGNFHPNRHVKRRELAVAIYETVAEMLRDERLRGPAGAPGPPGAAASDEDIARAIRRYTLEVSTDLADIRDDIVDLQDAGDELQDRIARVEAAVEALQRQIADISARDGRPDAP